MGAKDSTDEEGTALRLIPLFILRRKIKALDDNSESQLSSIFFGGLTEIVCWREMSFVSDC